MAKKVKIIGAGIAGLSAASYLQRNGYDTEIFEMHSLPGGLCTAWEKNGYTFDGCINWLVGSSPANPLYNIWNEVLDMKSIKCVEMDNYARIDDDRGNSLTLYSDADAFGAELKRHSPGHPDLVDEIVKGIKLFALKDDKNEALKEQKDAYIKKWMPVTLLEFAKRLENPFLEFALSMAFGDKAPVFVLALLLSDFHLKSAGFPVGGSLKFAQAIEKRYKKLGGKIRYNSGIAKILTKKDKACGLTLEDGKEVRADLVISAADGYHTVFKLLEGRYLNDEIKGFYAGKNPALQPYSSWVQISLGIKRTFEKEPHELIFKSGHPLDIDNKTKHDIANVRIYKFDPTLAPKGCTVVQATYITSDDQYWVDLREHDRQKYDLGKKRIADEYISILDKKLGNIRDNVEVIDVSTPATAIRYTNNWHGSIMGWGWGTQVPVWKQRELPGLGDFYMTGQWVTPAGGLPTVLLDGRNLAAKICEKDSREFKTGI